MIGIILAFSIGSGFTHSCHERITADAYEDFVLDLPTRNLKVPTGEIWRRISDLMLEEFNLDLESLDAAQRFLLVSLVVGVRAPDTEGHSSLNLENLRELHADPAPVGQYAHSLRGPDDDHSEGNAIAVEGTREALRDLVGQLSTTAVLSGQEALLTAPFYLDFYGRIDVEVWAPMYYIGRAAHLLQDSFAHTIRDKEDGLQSIVSVLNYVDAITTSHSASRDGLGHSDSQDDCTRDDNEAVVEAATEATIELFFATREILNGRDPDAIEHLIDRWLVLREGCDENNDYCGNTEQLEVIEDEQTGPYLGELANCQSAPGPGPWALLLLLAGGLRRRDDAH